jgi:hypothetical protein
MRYSNFTLAAVVLITTTAVTIHGQGQAPAAPKPAAPATAAAKPAANAAKIPRTLDGKPDMAGIWSAFILTPMQRPAGAPEFYTAEELAKKQDADQKDRLDLRIYPTVTPPGEKTTDAYNTLWRDGFWTKIGTGSLRTSQIVDPPDGRLPPTTPRVAELQAGRTMRQNRGAWGPEDRPLWTRCVRGQVSGPPLVGTGGSYNNNLQIVEGPDQVAIIQEMNHESQIVPLNNTPHLPPEMKLNKGDSRGHWEGDTLVIDTTNFIGATPLNAGVMSVGNGTTSDKLHVVERYQMLDANNILYHATVTDPDTWTKPFSIEFVIWRMQDQKLLNEYACHEGNRSLEYALSGARQLEAEGKESGGAGGDEEEAVK